MGPLVSLAAGLGIILSAETLVLVGNGVGRGGFGFLVLIAVGLALHLWGAVTVMSTPSGPDNEIGLLQRAFGSTAAMVLPIASRGTVAVIMAVGLPATAGFVFNEVFVYWFPNFLFAFLLLGLIFIVNLAGRRVWGVFQLLVVSTAVSGLAVLIVAGFLSSPNPTDAPVMPAGVGVWAQLAFSAVVCLVGYDLAVLSTGKSFGRAVKSPAGAALFGALLLILWGSVSLRWVPSAELARTTIPYTVAARTILGQGGRIVMGIVILAGTCAAVNAAFGAVSRMMTGMSAAGLLPHVLGEKRFKGKAPVVLLSAAAATMLVSGMAGSVYFDQYLRGGLVLWLIHYAALHLAGFLGRYRTDGLGPAGVAHIGSGVALGGFALAALPIADRPGVTVAFMAGAVGAVLALALIWKGSGRIRNYDRL